ncbi:hypothetical protein LSAT2_016345 [Lamellibrachia satsuma]|nr:hypothetical protein LSAT2_016345 [Lamellibrachia satsuma]
MADVAADSAEASDSRNGSGGRREIDPATVRGATPNEHKPKDDGHAVANDNPGGDTERNDDAGARGSPEHLQQDPEVGRQEEDVDGLPDMAGHKTESADSETIEHATSDEESSPPNTAESGLSGPETANSANAVDDGTPPEALKLDVASLDTESVYSLDTYRNDNDLSDDEFLARLERDDLELFREMQTWREKYHLDDDVLRDSATTLLTGAIDLRDEGLNEDEIARVKGELCGLDDLPLNDLIDRIASGDLT